MRLREIICESPVEYSDEMPREIYYLRGDYSVGALKRDFNYLFTIDVGGRNVDFMLNRWNTLLIGVYSGWENATDRVLPVFNLKILETPLIKVLPKELIGKKILQGSRIVLHADLRNFNIASQVYKRLINRGYAIISDDTHYEPARALWLKLAKNSGNEYNVMLCDVDHGPLKDMDGKTINYDGSNVPLEQVWTTGSDYSGSYIVLVMY